MQAGPSVVLSVVSAVSVVSVMVSVVVGASIARRRLAVPTRRPPARPADDVRARARTSPRPRRTLPGVPSDVVALGLVVLATGAALGPLLAASVATCALLWSRVRRVVAARRARAAIDRTLPDALDLLVLAVRAGLTPRQAVAELAGTAPEPTRPAFALVVHRTERGSGFADSLRALPEVLGPQANAVAEVIGTGDRYGLPLEPVLDQLTTEARAARRRAEQTEARQLPIRLAFPLVFCTLPSFVLLAIAPAVIAALSSLGGATW